MLQTRKYFSLVSLFAVVLAACGGGSDNGGSNPPAPAPGGPTPPPISSPPPSPTPPAPPPSAPTDAQRIAAATATAQANSLCNAVRPFYWEIGDRNAKLAFASVGAGAPVASDTMPIASSSKWVYGAYVTELRGGALTASDIQFLTFRSGYSQMGAFSCTSAATVDLCLGIGTNGMQDPSAVDKFFYNGGHMQRHAHDIGLGSFTPAALTTEVQRVIGNFGFAYASPQPPGGINTSADAYAAFLRKILAGQLQMAAKLGANAVCTNPSTCTDAVFTPITAESWHYSIGHWVEDDPTLGDGAFSSAGAFGFYPWIDRTKAWYGVLARQSSAGGEQGYASAQCGRLIRKAWVTGVTQ
jgi:hypothetical protein